MKMNPILAIDGYKVSHRVQYPQGTRRVYSNFTPRSDRFFSSPLADGKTGIFRPAGVYAVVFSRPV
ncbi:Nicotinamide phosphoribosyltransferase [Citrobacter freundii]|uniref:Nicotinamide phosphoribosyltransferase n=1 Tax=Citrobacter freundii TaxID=546 RepID=A0A7G2IGU7_CITFR|nr:Nicotinamide phosphoribosyltransferase [Citrobacter freundii]